MVMRFFLFFLVLIFFSFSLTDRKDYPQDYFASPVNHEIRLSGTFGELRPNHLHAGIDIKARGGKIGQPLFAAAEGYVARVKMQSGSYGKVLYISHPNGYTSVYTHLHKFTPELEQYVKDQQYNKKSFEVDLYPEAGKFNFSQGQQIGTLGLSGRSYGPHLHFEIRDTETEKPINPLLFGIKIKDTRAPMLNQLKVYLLNDKRETGDTKIYNLIDAGSRHRIKGDTLMLSGWRAGFGLKTYDHMNSTSNWNGVYAVQTYLDDDLIYGFEMETFDFGETRYINAHLDYEEQVAKKSYFNRCYSLPGNRLSIYPEHKNHGVVKLLKNKAQKITMVSEDMAGNRSKLEFWVKRKPVKEVENEPYNYFLPYDEENIIDNEALYLYFPARTLYENLYMEYAASREKAANLYSSVHQIHNYETPVHRYFDIGIRSVGLPDSLRSKAFIAYCDKKNVISNCGGKWKDGKLTTKVRDLGDYSIMVDTEPPTIRVKNFKSNMKGYNTMSFVIKDNFKTARNVTYLDYKAMVDGQWILMEYDAKNDLLTHRFDGTIKPGEHVLRLRVTDNCGNERLYKKTFVR